MRHRGMRLKMLVFCVGGLVLAGPAIAFGLGAVARSCCSEGVR